MIEDPPVLTIKRPTRRPSSAQIAAFQGVPTGFVVDAMNGTGALSAAISPLDASGPVAGPALTAGNGAADCLATLGAMSFVQPGDVLLAGVEGHQGCAAIGDRVCGIAKNGGAVALVTDGPARDLRGILDVGLPVWCTGLTPATPFNSGPGSIGLPIHIGGQTVDTGDMVIADGDGVVIVPFDQIDAVRARLDTVRALETELDSKVADGAREFPRIEALLASGRVTFVD